jgi:hypothetical protein
VGRVFFFLNETRKIVHMVCKIFPQASPIKQIVILKQRILEKKRKSNKKTCHTFQVGSDEFVFGDLSVLLANRCFESKVDNLFSFCEQQQHQQELFFFPPSPERFCCPPHRTFRGTGLELCETFPELPLQPCPAWRAPPNRARAL